MLIIVLPNSILPPSANENIVRACVLQNLFFDYSRIVLFPILSIHLFAFRFVFVAYGVLQNLFYLEKHLVLACFCS